MDLEKPSNLKVCVATMNRLLRGERSAVEAYDLVIEKFGEDASIHVLRAIRDDHTESITDLIDAIHRLGGTAGADSGAWGTIVGVIQSTANLFGETSAVNSLLAGEMRGKDEYIAALDGDCIGPECRTLVLTELLPRIQSHIMTLEDLDDLF